MRWLSGEHFCANVPMIMSPYSAVTDKSYYSYCLQPRFFCCLAYMAISKWHEKGYRMFLWLDHHHNIACEIRKSLGKMKWHFFKKFCKISQISWSLCKWLPLILTELWWNLTFSLKLLVATISQSHKPAKTHSTNFLHLFWTISPDFSGTYEPCKCMKLQLHAKFQRNSMKGCRENPGQTYEQTNERTDGRKNGQTND